MMRPARFAIFGGCLRTMEAQTHLGISSPPYLWTQETPLAPRVGRRHDRASGYGKRKIFSVDSQSGVVTEMLFDPAIPKPSSQVFQFSFLDGGIVIARYQAFLLRLDTNRENWTSIKGNGLPTNEGTLYFMAVVALHFIAGTTFSRFQ